MIKKTFKISILLVVLAALSIFISCKTQPTAVSDFQTIEEIPNTTPTPTDTNGSTNINITIDNSKGLSQFYGSYYESGDYYVNGNIARYYATVSNNCIVVGARYTDKNRAEGYQLEEDANMYLTDSSQTGASYSLKGTRFSQQNVNTATATFTEDGYLIIKFSNVSSEIIYSLQSKSEDNNQNIDDISGFTRSQLVSKEGWWMNGERIFYVDISYTNGVMYCEWDNAILWQGSPSTFYNEKITEFKSLDIACSRWSGYNTVSYIFTSSSNMTRILSNSSSGESKTYDYKLMIIK